MGSGLKRMILQTPVEVWREVPGVIKALDEASGSYTVTVKGLDVGPVWSVNGRRHAVGNTVTVLMRGSIPVGLVP